MQGTEGSPVAKDNGRSWALWLKPRLGGVTFTMGRSVASASRARDNIKLHARRRPGALVASADLG
jgi:hypothetical protein